MYMYMLGHASCGDRSLTSAMLSLCFKGSTIVINTEMQMLKFLKIHMIHLNEIFVFKHNSHVVCAFECTWTKIHDNILHFVIAIPCSLFVTLLCLLLLVWNCPIEFCGHTHVMRKRYKTVETVPFLTLFF